MTPEYLLKKMIEYGSAMRAAQKGYFNFKDKNAPTKALLLEKSKKAEKEFDSLIEQAKLIVK